MRCAMCKSAIQKDDMFVECTDGSVICSMCVAEAMRDKYEEEGVNENDQ